LIADWRADALAADVCGLLPKSFAVSSYTTSAVDDDVDVAMPCDLTTHVWSGGSML
jgi:hypothetical protein